jgi:hypothetical protein
MNQTYTYYHQFGLTMSFTVSGGGVRAPRPWPVNGTVRRPM